MDKIKCKAEIWYLFNSGFAMKTDKHFLIFDYYIDTPAGENRCLESGVINPDEIKDLDVYVFASHWHPDHFNPVILEWRKNIPHIHYILSKDIKKAEPNDDITVARPGSEYKVGDISVRVLRSTDVGSAFLVKTDGLCVYHAGDLNWWHWNGEPENDNLQMAQRYKKEIDSLKGEHIDIAFVPVDPRLEENYLLGLDYFMETVGAELVFPMHFSDDFDIFRRIRQDESAEVYCGRVADITHRGENFLYT